MDHSPPELSEAQQARKDWLSLLAKSPAARLEALMALQPKAPQFDWLRAPETGGVMLRGRAGGTGAPFNFGEMTVTRCALRLSSGEVGHGYVQGRDKRHAQRAAMVDALMQTAQAGALREAVLEPLAFEAEATRQTKAAKAGATKVDFFTMVRGED